MVQEGKLSLCVRGVGWEDGVVDLRSTVVNNVIFGKGGSNPGGRRSGIGAGTGGAACVGKARNSNTTGVGTRVEEGETKERGG